MRRTVLLPLLLLAACAHSQYSASGSESPGELDASRRVNAQDCTKPIQDPSANLRCR